jgi:hypothetical protein
MVGNKVCKWIVRKISTFQVILHSVVYLFKQMDLHICKYYFIGTSIAVWIEYQRLWVHDPVEPVLSFLNINDFYQDTLPPWIITSFLSLKSQLDFFVYKSYCIKKCIWPINK